MKKTCVVALAVLLISLGVCVVQATNLKNATLTLLNDSVSSEGAMCLDGSATGYFMRQGYGIGTNKWIVHLGGGGWCTNSSNCYNRSFTPLGSSIAWPNSTALNGFLSDNSTVNPDFYNWNIVYVMYCDGASFAGYVHEPDVFNQKKLYYRGRVNLKVTLDDLLTSRDMNRATDVILTGCSAGGLATYLHADAVKDYLPQTIKFRAFPDAGYFLDTPNINGTPAFRTGVQNVFKMQNLSAGVNQDCIRNHKPNDRWMCFFAPYAYQFVKTPIFVLNSMYDTAQLLGIYQLPCLPLTQNCSSKYVEAFYNYGALFLRDAKPVYMSTLAKNGFFIDSCMIHCQTLFDIPWSTFSIKKQSISNTFTHWYYQKGSEATNITRLTDCEVPYSCNPTCPGVYKQVSEQQLPVSFTT